MKNKNIMFYLTSRFLASLGDQFLLFSVPLIIYHATHSAAMTGLAFFIEWLPRILSLPIGGVLSDRFGARKIYLVADSVRCVVCIAAFVLAMMHFNIFYVTSFMMAICAFFYAQSFIALESSLPKLTTVDQLPKYQSIIQGVEQSTYILGPALATIMVNFIKPINLILFASTVFLLSFSIIFCLKQFTLKLGRVNRENHIIKDFKTGFLNLIHSSPLCYLTILTVSVNLLWGMALATNAAFVTGVYQKSNTLFGVLQSTSGFSALCCFLLLPIFLKKISTFSIGIVAYSMMVLGALLIGASHEVIYYFIGYILILSFDGVFNVYIRSKRVEFISQSDFGKTIGVIVFANQLSMPLSGLFVRFFATAIGLHALFLAMAFVALLSSFCFIKLAPEYNLLTAKNFFRLKN